MSCRISYKQNCSYCLSDFTNMSDPRRLPCNHIFCYACLQTGSEFSSLKCPLDRNTFKNISFDDLPKVEVPGCSARSCDLKSSVFCVTCQLKLCDKHAQAENDEQMIWDYEAHYHVPIIMFLSNSSHYEKCICPAEGHGEVREQCTQCLSVFCKECDTSQPCSVTEGKHILIKITKELAAACKDSLQSFSTLISKTRKDFVSVSQDIKIAETQNKWLRGNLHAIVEKKIAEIRTEEKRIVEQLEESEYETALRNLKKLASDTETKADKLVEECYKLGQVELEGKLVMDYGILQPQLKEIIEMEIPKLGKPPPRFVTSESQGLFQLAMHDAVYKLQYKHCHYIPENVKDVVDIQLLQSREPVVVTEVGLVHLTPRTSAYQPIDLTNCYGIERCSEGYVVMKFEHKLTIYLYKFDEKEPNEIFTEASANIAAMKLMVVKRNIILFNYKRKEYRVLDLEGKVLSKCVLSGSKSILKACALSDRSFLLLEDQEDCGKTVSKYSIGKKAATWSCDIIADASGIAEDSTTGLILVSESTGRNLHLLSNSGQYLGKVTDPLRQEGVKHLAMHDDMIVVGDDNLVQTYKRTLF